MPAWFLRLAAPVVSGPVTDLINQSLMKSVPSQWKWAHIRPAPKMLTPQQAVDYRPISITLVLTCLMEHIVVWCYIYPALSSPPLALHIADQFAFRLMASLTAAIISTQHHHHLAVH